MATPETSPVASTPKTARPQDGVAVLVSVAVAAGAASWGLLAPASALSHVFVVAGASLVLAGVTTVYAWRVSRDVSLSERHRAAWRSITWSWLALMFYYAGQLSLRTSGDSHPSISYTALLPTAMAPVLFWGLVRLPPAARSSRDVAVAGIDAALVVGASWMVIWQFVVGPAVARGLAGTGVGPIAVVALVADLLIFGGTAFVLLRCPRGSRRATLLLIAGACAALIVADVVRASAIWGADAHAMGDLLFLIAPVLTTLAAVVKRDRLARGRDDADDDLALRPVTVLPYVAIVVGYGVVLVASAWPSASGMLPLLIFTGVLPVLVIIRQWTLTRESSRLQRERTLLSGDARFRSLVRHASDVVTIVDAGWTITFASPSAQTVLGYRPSFLVGSSVLDLLHPDDVADAANRLRELVADPSRPMCGSWRMRRSDQTTIDTDTVCVNLFADEHVRGIVLTTRDVSERRSLEAQLTHQAFHDPLTGLANRALFLDRVQHSLARRRDGSMDTLGVVFVDLDHFKAVNDNFGHAGGDTLLKAAAERLVRGLRAFDTAARLGGDEFAILVDDLHRQGDVAQVADRIMRAFREPFNIDGRELRTSASVGMAIAAEGQTAEDLVRNADLAMYLAKSRGRGQSAIFEPAMHAAATTRLELQRDLRHALDRGELSLAYQPIHALDSQALVGAEALLRWVHPTRGPIPPATFVPLAEEAGLMGPIGRWVLEQACIDAESWRDDNGGRPLRVSVNLSGHQIPDDGLYAHVERAVKDSGLVPSSLVLELTERVLLQHTDRALALLHRLKALGVRVAIDDFGTGVSSLSYLQRLPIDMLKIDRSFVDAIVTDTHAAQLTRAIVGLSESMSLLTVAEGIESAEQAERLRSLGCDYGQGYLFGMPMSADALASHAERSRAFAAF